MDFQDFLSRRLDDLRAELATIRHRLDALERRPERPVSFGGEEWGWWLLPLMTLAASVLGGLALVTIVRAVRPC